MNNDYFDGLFDLPHEPLPAPASTRLPALRRTAAEAVRAAAAARGRAVRVTTYVLAEDHDALARQREELLAYAAKRGWAATSEHFGETTLTPAGAQLALNDALQYVRRAFADGILMPGRDSIRQEPDAYERTLRRLHDWSGFIEFLPLLRSPAAGLVRHR
ncbi:hypothetical protein [Streptomyces sp. NPDC015350]|uniref:hypothetical protein n=1 Tax=Streptomyces sp. NPDC015350 TaxID=3364955 RepID=UPI0036F94D25